MENLIQDTEENIDEIQNVINESSNTIEAENIQVGDILSRDKFRQRFNDFFNMLGDMTQIEGLKIHSENKFEFSGATATADRLYMCAEKYKFMKFLIENNGGWLGDALLIGGFCYAKINVVAYHYTGRSVGERLLAKIRLKPATPEKQGYFSKLFKKDNENEEKTSE